jgi:hypothetical protein
MERERHTAITDADPLSTITVAGAMPIVARTALAAHRHRAA